MFKNTAIVTLFLVLSSVLGFIAQIVYVSSFGASSEMDIYFTLLSVPTIITGMAPVIFTSVLLPNFAKLKSVESELKSFINSLWSYILLFSILFAVIGCSITIYNIHILIPNLSSKLHTTAIEVSLMLWIGSGVFIASSYLAAVLNYNKKFIKVAWTSVLPAFLMILLVMIFHNYIGIRSISLGLFLANLIQFTVFFKAVIPYFSLSKFKKLLTQTFFVILSLLPFTIFVPIGYYWASYLPNGSVSFLGYSQSFSGFLSVATGMGIAIVSFPNLADDFANGNGNEAFYKFELTLKYVLLISLFAAAAFIALRIPILTLFYQHGSFTQSSVIKLANVIPWYLVAAIFIAGLNLLRTLFYSMGEYKKIAILGIVIPVVFFILSGVLKDHFSVVGIGIANALSFTLLFISSIIVIKFKSKSKEFLSSNFLFFIMKNIITSIFAGFITTYTFSWISVSISQVPSITICFVLFTGTYFLIAKYIFKMTEIIVIENVITNQIKVVRR